MIYEKDPAIEKIIRKMQKPSPAKFNNFMIRAYDKNDILNAVCKRTGYFMQTDVRVAGDLLEICEIDFQASHGN